MQSLESASSIMPPAATDGFHPKNDTSPAKGFFVEPREPLATVGYTESLHGTEKLSSE